MKVIIDVTKLQIIKNQLGVEEFTQYICKEIDNLNCGGQNEWTEKLPNSRTKKEVILAGGYTDEFECFWKLYPKRIGKGAAFSLWQKLTENKKELLDRIKEAIAWQQKTEQWKQESGKYIPHPQTYLSQRRWEDENPVGETSTEERYLDINGIWRTR